MLDLFEPAFTGYARVPAISPNSSQNCARRRLEPQRRRLDNPNHVIPVVELAKALEADCHRRALVDPPIEVRLKEVSERPERRITPPFDAGHTGGLGRSCCISMSRESDSAAALIGAITR